MSQFNPINPPFGWKEEWTKYPHGYTIYEALLDWLKHVNDLTTNVNDWNTYLENFVATFDTELQAQVTSVVQGWIADGTIEVIITEGLQTRINELELIVKDISVNVKDYGALGDGLTNDYPAFASALSDMVTHGYKKLRVPAGHYILNSELVVDHDITLITDGQSTVLDFSGASVVTGVSLNFKGSMELLPALSGGLDHHTQTISFLAAPSVVVGDVLILYNSVNFSYSAFQSYYRAGEFVRVKSVVGNVVTVDAPLYDAYPSTTNVYKVNPVHVDLDGLTLISQPLSVGLRAELAVHSSFKNITVKNTQVINFQLYRSFECHVDGVTSIDLNSPVQTNYGLAISNCQSVDVSHLKLTTVRHGISIGGAGNPGDVPNRKIKVSDSFIGGLTQAGGGLAADVHGNSEFVSFVDCFIENGIDVAGNHVSVKRSQIRQHGATGNYIYMSELNGCNFDFEDLTCIQTIGTTINNITATVQASTQYDGTFSFKNITVLSEKSSKVVGRFILIVVNDNTTIKPDVLIDRLKVKTTDTTLDNFVRIEGIGVGAFDTINITNCELENIRFYMRQVDARFIRFTHNTVLGNYVGDGIAVESKATTALTEQYIDIIGNRCINNGYCGVSVSGASNTFALINVIGNTLLDGFKINSGGSSANKANFLSSKALLLVFKDNILGDRRGVAQQVRVYTVSDIAEFIEEDNVILGSVSTISVSATKVSSGYKYAGKQNVAYGAGIPTVGTYKVGDVVLNVTPTASGVYGWVCVTAGTPGVWKSFATVSA